MVAYEYEGLDNFAALFQTSKAAFENQIKESETDRFLKLLEEIERTTQKPQENKGDDCNCSSQRVEHYIVVDAKGNIINETDAKGRDALVKKTHTMSDLPKESEFEMIFGKQPEPKEMFEVKTDLRLKDGKEYHRLQFPDSSDVLFQWHGLRFELVVIIISFVGLCLYTFLKFREFRRKMRRKPVKYNDEIPKADQIQRLIRETIRQELAESPQKSFASKEVLTPQTVDPIFTRRKIYAGDLL